MTANASAKAPYTHQIQLRFSDLDAMGHVNNARYLSYIEDARIGLLRQIIDTIGEEAPPGLILARSEIDHRRPITLSTEPLRIDVWVADVGGKSFTLQYEIRQSGQVAAQARSVMVAFDYATASTRLLTGQERDDLLKWRLAR